MRECKWPATGTCPGNENAGISLLELAVAFMATTGQSQQPWQRHKPLRSHGQKLQPHLGTCWFNSNTWHPTRCGPQHQWAESPRHFSLGDRIAPRDIPNDQLSRDNSRSNASAERSQRAKATTNYSHPGTRSHNPGIAHSVPQISENTQQSGDLDYKKTKRRFANSANLDTTWPMQEPKAENTDAFRKSCPTFVTHRGQGNWLQERSLNMGDIRRPEMTSEDLRRDDAV